jgi:glycosyltransferase involved in cell wall biosynthesis
MRNRKKPNSVSLIITTYNDPQKLQYILHSVAQQTMLPDEVIIADDGSTEDTAQLINTIRPSFPIPILHCWQENQGFRAAMIRNKALAKSHREYIIFTDGDMILHRHFIRDHIQSAEKNFYLQGARVLLSQKTTNQIDLRKIFSWNFFSKGTKNSFNTISCAIFSKYFSKKITRFVINGTKTCNLSVWRNDALKVNGFDESFVGWGREDSEFVARLYFSGIHRKNIRFGAVSYHTYHKENLDIKQLQHNDELLNHTIKTHATWCDNGVNKYLHHNPD